MREGTAASRLARDVHSPLHMKPSDLTSAERWLVIAGCLPLIGFGVLFLLG